MSLGLGPVSSLPVSAIPSPSATPTIEEVGTQQQPAADNAVVQTTFASEDFVPHAAGTVPLEEAPPAALFPIADPTLPAPSNEDIVATVTSTPDEVSTFRQPPPVDLAAWLAIPSEDFGGAHPTEETSLFTLVAIDEPPLLVRSVEDFAGSLPAEEVSTFKLIALDDPPLWPALPNEDFGGVHPTEETSPPLWSPLDEPTWQTLGAEDFAGSLPAEEVSTFKLIALDDPPLWPALPNEDFGGVHPTEETSPPLWSPLDEPTWQTLGAEDFAGSLPAEEVSTFKLIALDDPPLWPALPNEDFGGVHPTEETSPPLWSPLDEPTWQTLGAEDFAGSLPAEEVSTFKLIALDDPPLWPALPNEDFGGVHPTEETPPPLWSPLDEPTWQTLGAEDFAGSLPAEEGSAFTLIVSVEPSGTASIGEDFATASLAVDEPSPPATVGIDAPALWSMLVSEELAQPTGLEEVSLPPWSPLDTPAWRTFSIEDYVAVVAVEETSTFTQVLSEEPPLWSPISFEDIVGRFVGDEVGTSPWVLPLHEPVWRTMSDEDFGGARIALDETSAFLFVHLPVPTPWPVLVGEDILVPGTALDEETSWQPFPRTLLPAPSFPVGEEYPRPFVPPPPPRPRPPTSDGDCRNLDWEWRKRLAELEARWVTYTVAEDPVLAWEWLQQLAEWEAAQAAARIQPAVLEDITPEAVAQLVGQADYVLLPTGDGLEVKALASGTIYQLLHDKAGLCAVLVDDDGVRYLYARLRGFFGQTGRRVEVGDTIGLSGGDAPESSTIASGEFVGVTMSGLPATSTQPAATTRPLALNAAPPTSDAPPPVGLVDDRRWPDPNSVPRSSIMKHAALLSLFVLPLINPAAAVPIIMTTLAGLLVFALGRAKKAPGMTPRRTLGMSAHPTKTLQGGPGKGGPAEAPENAPSIDFTFDDKNDTSLLTVPANVWVVVQLPPPATGEAYRFAGEVPPLTTNDPAKKVRVGGDLSSYALPLSSGFGTMRFHRVNAKDWSQVLKTYTIHVDVGSKRPSAQPVTAGRGNRSAAAAPDGAVSTVFEFRSTDDTDALTVAADSWLVVKLPAPGKGRVYRFAGEMPPLANGEPSTTVQSGSDRASYALRLGSGSGSMTFKLVSMHDASIVIRTYTLRVSAVVTQ